MYIYTEDDDMWMEAERAARERIQDVNDKIQKARIEVAREIFEEIEESIATHAYTSKSEDYMDGASDTIEWVDSKIDELKKKYTEGKV